MSLKKTCLLAAAAFLALCPAFAQEAATSDEGDHGELTKYRRSSLYSVLVKHSDFPYSAEIDSAFMVMPIPDKFNDHNIDLRSFESSAVKMKKRSRGKTELNKKDIASFMSQNQIAKALVARWFDRNPETGGFDMDLIQSRGFYDASQLDISTARESSRGMSALGDAGEQLIGNTFLIFNDITFVDKGERSSTVAGFLSLTGSLLSELSGDSSYQTVGDLAAGAANEIDGFRVNITTYLYRLVWNDEVAATFYQDYWFGGGEDNPERRFAFDASDIFTVDYVGETTTSAANLASKNFSSKSKGAQMLKVCTRAVDKAIVELQREYDEFKVNVPIYRISEDGKTVDVQIGLKEGINEKSRFEVLMPVEDEDGNLQYEKIGMIQPEKGKIWDNRFGALEEAREAASEDGPKSKDEDAADLESAMLTASTFKVTSGAGKIVPGCLVREVTIKRGF